MMLTGTKGGRVPLIAVSFGGVTECDGGLEVDSPSLAFSLLLRVLLGVEGKAERRRGVPFIAFFGLKQVENEVMVEEKAVT